jgi:hypothetical protein
MTLSDAVCHAHAITGPQRLWMFPTFHYLKSSMKRHPMQCKGTSNIGDNDHFAPPDAALTSTRKHHAQARCLISSLIGSQCDDPTCTMPTEDQTAAVCVYHHWQCLFPLGLQLSLSVRHFHSEMGQQHPSNVNNMAMHD